MSEAAGATPMAVTITTGGVTFPDAVSVAVAVGGGTASEGVDYAEVADFDVIIPAGQTSATETFTLTPTQDGLPEGDETINIDGDLSGYGYTVPSTRVTLSDDATAHQRIDRVNRELLPHVARALLASSISAINECGIAMRSPGSNLMDLVDANGEAFETGRTSLEQVLGGVDFTLPLRAAQQQETQAPSLLNTVWGCGDYRTLSDRQDGGIDWDGNLFSLHLGIDLQPTRNLVTGIAVSHSLARFDYQDTLSGRHKSRMTSVSPYLRWIAVPAPGLLGNDRHGLGFGEGGRRGGGQRAERCGPADGRGGARQRVALVGTCGHRQPDEPEAQGAGFLGAAGRRRQRGDECPDGERQPLAPGA